MFIPLTARNVRSFHNRERNERSSDGDRYRSCQVELNVARGSRRTRARALAQTQRSKAVDFSGEMKVRLDGSKGALIKASH